jgi:hypothetical protein
MTTRRILGAFLIAAIVVALMLVMNWTSIRERRQAAFIATALSGDTERMKFLLSVGASPEERTCDAAWCLTPLIAASISGNPDAVHLLLDRGANVNGKMKRGQTALTVAAYKGNREVVTLLLIKGADVNANWEGCTSLGAAKQKGHTEIAEILSKYGAVKLGNCDE